MPFLKILEMDKKNRSTLDPDPDSTPLCTYRHVPVRQWYEWILSNPVNLEGFKFWQEFIVLYLVYPFQMIYGRFKSFHERFDFFAHFLQFKAITWLNCNLAAIIGFWLITFRALFIDYQLVVLLFLLVFSNWFQKQLKILLKESEIVVLLNRFFIAKFCPTFFTRCYRTSFAVFFGQSSFLFALFAFENFFIKLNKCSRRTIAH